MLRTTLSSRIAIAAVVGLTWTAAPHVAHADEWRIATLAPPGSVWMKILEEGAADLEKKTEGRIKIKYYPGGVQGDEQDVVRKMRLGQLDGGAMTTIGLSMVVPAIRVLELPRMYDSRREMVYVRRRLWRTFQYRFFKKGFMLGNPGEVGPIHFYSYNKVTSLPQLRKQKVWRWTGDVITRAMFREVGIPGVPLGVPAVRPALAAGKVNAFYTAPVAAVALQWYSKVRYVSAQPMSYAVGATLMRRKVWELAVLSDQRLQQKLSKRWGKKLRKRVRRQTRRAKAAMSTTIRSVPISPAMLAQFDTAAQKVWCKLMGKVYSKKDLQLVLKFRDEYRKNKKRPPGPIPACAR